MINFPSNPVLDQVVVLADKTFKFDGVAWRIQLPEPAEHNAFPNIQGGGPGDYQHLTTAQLAMIGAGGATVSDTPPVSPTNGQLWYNSATGTLLVYYNDGTSSQWVDPSPGIVTSIPEVILNYNANGYLSTNTGAVRQYPTSVTNLTNWEMWVSTAPTGANLIAQIVKNNTTVIETLTLPAGAEYASGAASAALATTDYITVNITQVGVPVAGSNLSIRLRGTI